MAIYGNYDHKLYWYPHFPRNPQFPSQALKAEDFKSLGLGDLCDKDRETKSVGLMGKKYRERLCKVETCLWSKPHPTPRSFQIEVPRPLKEGFATVSNRNQLK